MLCAKTGRLKGHSHAFQGNLFSCVAHHQLPIINVKPIHVSIRMKQLGEDNITEWPIHHTKVRLSVLSNHQLVSHIHQATT